MLSIEDYMWNWTMSVADGGNRRMAGHREVYCPPSFSTSTLTTSLFSTEHVASYTQTIYVSQQPSFIEVETTIEEALSELTQTWNRPDRENTPHPKYLSVTLDRTLSYKNIVLFHVCVCSLSDSSIVVSTSMKEGCRDT